MGNARDNGAFIQHLSRTVNVSNEKDYTRGPLVSIFIPAYNRDRYLSDTLDSLLSQTFRDFEILIADDGSSDRTLEIASDYAQRDSRIRYLSLPHQGEVRTRNEAVRRAYPRSKYLMNHDSDDVSLPDKLNKLVSYLETHPDVAIVGCFAEYFDDFGNHLGNPPIEHEPNRIRSTFGERNSMINSAALIRREVFGRLAGYKEEFLRLDDYEFFSRALMAGFTLSNIPEVLHRVRLHPNTISRVYAPRVAMLTEVIQSDYIRYQRTRDASLWKRGQIWLSCCYRKWKAHARYSIYAFKSRLVRKKKQRVS